MVVHLILVGCAGTHAYRLDDRDCISATPEHECTESTLEIYPDAASADDGYLLGFVEFDDQGALQDRRQMHRVIDRLADLAGRRDTVIVVFVHGWKHDAAPGDENVHMFRETLRELSALEGALSAATRRPRRQVAGVYLGWRGRSVDVPVIKQLSFWDRKKTAHIVGAGAVAEVLARLEQIQKVRESLDDQNETRLVVVGHSFGAALVYSALAEHFASRFVFSATSPGITGDVEGYGDLVVLINPAFEAARYAPLSDMANERQTYFPAQLPVLAVLTSTADDATRIAFPIGRWFSTAFERHRDVEQSDPVSGATVVIDQRESNRHTVGHFLPYRTHTLAAAEGSPGGTALTAFGRASTGWEQDGPGNTIPFQGSTLTRGDDSVARNPFLVVAVDPALIPNHSDIYDPRVRDFLIGLIQISMQSDDMARRELVRSRAMSVQPDR